MIAFIWIMGEASEGLKMTFYSTGDAQERVLKISSLINNTCIVREGHFGVFDL